MGEVGCGTADRYEKPDILPVAGLVGLVSTGKTLACTMGEACGRRVFPPLDRVGSG